LNNKEVKKKKRKLNIQKIFNLVSFTFILACCIFYGSRFISLYLDNNKTKEVKVLANKIINNNKDNDNFKKINEDYYFQGNDVDNYLAYSNLTWRIIRVNSNNSVTAVLDNSITSLAASSDNSYIDMWLNNKDEEYTGILEKSLNNTNKYLTDTYTCKDIVEDINSINCTNKTEDTLITVPSLNDYANTGGSDSFMNNDEYYYLTNSNNDNKIWYVNSEGNINTSNGEDIMGIKPVITINNTTKLIEGKGTKDNPYIIEKETGLFGSYVKLGDEIWRIYSVEGDNIKLSLDGYLKVNNNETTYKYSNNGYYHNDTVQGTLAYYLKNTYLKSLSYKNIVNKVEYSNGLYSNTTNYDYRKVLKTKVDTKVTVLSIGDIFLNPLNTNYYTSTGISKDSNLVYVMSNNFKLYTKIAVQELKIVPVISINKNILTEGKGTIDSPLEVK